MYSNPSNMGTLIDNSEDRKGNAWVLLAQNDGHSG